MNNDGRTLLIGAGIFLCIIGGFVVFTLPYDVESSHQYYNAYSHRYETITSTVTLYGHPAGWVFDGIGVLMILAGLMMYPNGSIQSTHRTFHGKVCGNCFMFGKEDCKRNEKMFNAMPCQDFTP